MKFGRVLGILSSGLFVSLVFLTPEARADGTTESAVPIRIGWQIPAATQGQVLQVLKRTSVLEGHGLKPVFVPFSYGGPQVEAAFAGDLDVFFSGDQPAINLIARGGKWKIVARLFDDGVGIIVPPNSTIQSVEDLEGTTVASPFGSVAHRDAFMEQEAAGLDSQRDVLNKNLDILEIRRRVQAGGNGTWDGFDAAVIWEPLISRFELEGIARRITSERYVGVVSVSEEFIENHPEAVVELLVALTRAWDFFARNQDRVMQWYIDDTRLDYTPESLVAARLDSNFAATSVNEISLDLHPDYIATLERAATWARESGEGLVDISHAVDTRLLTTAIEKVASHQFEDIQVILPSTYEKRSADQDILYDLNSTPLWMAFTAMVAMAVLAIELGFLLGKRNREKVEDKQMTPIATVAGAVLAMMAFVIAFTFGSANTRFDARKAALLDDVAAIQTAYLRANLIPEPQRTTVRNLLRDYVQARAGIVYAYGQPETLRLVQQRANVSQELMWSHVEALAEKQGETKAFLLFTRSLNDVFNLHTKRVVLGAYYRIPPAMWLALILASGVAMFAVGFQFGIGGNQRIHASTLALAITFALVMVLAFDLDRAGEGLVAVNQQPMIDLYESMRK
ncbi:MAG: ABC transporter substrate-binding protein [Deltaproteobacteria bacterium]|nr:ABC transporter substrate-binding protein [Deltaproteobacteria bacterium]